MRFDPTFHLSEPTAHRLNDGLGLGRTGHNAATRSLSKEFVDIHWNARFQLDVAGGLPGGQYKIVTPGVDLGLCNFDHFLEIVPHLTKEGGWEQVLYSILVRVRLAASVDRHNWAPNEVI